MTAKRYLSELQLMSAKIEQLQEQRQMYLEMATSITVPFNPVKVQTSRKVDRIGDNTSKAADLGKRIDEEINILLNRQQETIKMIQSLHNGGPPSSASKDIYRPVFYHDFPPGTSPGSSGPVWKERRPSPGETALLGFPGLRFFHLARKRGLPCPSPPHENGRMPEKTGEKPSGVWMLS